MFGEGKSATCDQQPTGITGWNRWSLVFVPVRLSGTAILVSVGKPMALQAHLERHQFIYLFYFVFSSVLFLKCSIAAF